MSATSSLTVMAMLAVVLGIMGIVLKLIRKYTVSGAVSKSGVKMEIIQRITLGQRQGLAVVRVGARTLVVSMGEGGVHQVAELNETDLTTDATNSAAAPALETITGGLRKLSLLRGGNDAAPAAQKRAEKRISYVAPMEDFQAVLSMAMSGARA